MGEQKVNILKSNNLGMFLEGLIEQWPVYGPMRSEAGDVSFEQIRDAKDLCLVPGPVSISPKELFLPQNACLLCGSKDTYRKGYSKMGPRVIFGLRPCDVRAISILDRVMEADYTDAFFKDMREDAFLVSLACKEPLHQCFCTSVGGGPVSEGILDVELMEMDNGDYLIQTGSKKGELLLDAVAGLLDQIDIDRDGFVSEFRTIAAKRMRKVDSMDSVVQSFKELNKDFWTEYGGACMHCGSCSFSCPTCYCFDVTDKTTSSDEKRRFRIWDCCNLKGYTDMAGGESPVQEWERQKRFFEHKIVELKEQLGEFGCVGCGRCEKVCYGDIAMRNLLCTVGAGDVHEC